MNLNGPDHLNLFLPQWQGSGNDNILFYGARLIRTSLSKTQFCEIDVPENQDLIEKNHILGYDAVLSQLEAAFGVIQKKQPRSIFTLGGDCAVSLAPVSYLNRYYHKNMALVWLDAHADLNTPSSSPSKHFHGMPLRVLLGDGDDDILNACNSIITPDQVVLAGTREWDPPEAAYLAEQPMTQLPIDILEQDPDSLAETVRKKGVDTVFVHIDLDVLDPVLYPDVKHPTPGGLSKEALSRALSGLLTDVTVVGLDMVEFAPKRQDRIISGLAEIKTLLDLFQEQG